MSTIRIAAALIVRDDGETLLVRKRGTTAFMQPGGKIEPGESPHEALVRELAEEIGLLVDPDRLTLLGRFEATAANEPDHIVIADVFRLDVTAADRIEAAAEIEEAVWISPHAQADIPMAPLTEYLILPHYRRTLSAGDV
ncbi:NUDIX hydrolase [Rhizobium tubonense]|uniref:NUDIX hydrolase n=1 Tax=Rhizobium tubonense TaxID=484088 RepID=UPI0019D43A7D|nr:NUDIX domain-containing protein [Rhizobium tubonense]